MGRIPIKRMTGPVVLLAVLIAGVQASSARIINGCEIKPSTRCPGADLHGADLRNADLSASDLRNVNLSDAYMTSINLRGAFLLGADLQHAKLLTANLSDADMGGAKLIDADLRSADLQRAHLQSAELSGAFVTAARLTDAYLPGADLHRAHLERANLQRATLYLDNLRIANLAQANLSFADLAEADLTGAKLTDADLHGARFCNTTMPDGSTNNSGCPPNGKPPLSRSKTFVLAANTTRAFDVGYPLALKYRHASYSCRARVSGPGKRYVKILSRRSARGGTVCRVRARNHAKLPSLDTTAKITVTATLFADQR